MGDHDEDRGRRALREVGRPAPFRRGDRLIVAGSESTEVLLIEAGLVKVVLQDREGTETLAGLFGHDDLLGEMGVIGDRPRSAHVVALSGGQAVHISGSAFLRLHRQNRHVQEIVAETWRKRQQDADGRQLAQTREVSTRVAMSLLKWAREFGGSTGQGLLLQGVSQRDIAQAVCASEKTVEAVLGELRAVGLLRTGRLKYLLLSPYALERWILGIKSESGR